MYDKYVIRTYPENCIQENSESDSENELSNLPFKKATYVNDNEYTDDNIIPSYINKETNNISYYPPNSKINLKERQIKNKTILQKQMNVNYDSDIINKQNRTNINYLNLNDNKKNYFYNKLKKEEESKENTFEQYYSNDRVDLNKYFNIKQAELHLPSRTLKKYKAQYLDVEKSDNFKVLSYRPEDYETDINKPKKNSKIIQVFKKQEASELFFPSKRARSPPSSPTSAKNSTKKLEKKIDNNKFQSFYQAPTLKFQSFFGSFMQPKKAKNLNQAKSTSKSRVNQLHDFNIEKLIEIGDNKSNKFGNILSFGKKIKSLKNRHKIKKKLIEKENMKYKARTEINTNEETQTPIQRIQIDSKDYNLMRRANNNTNKKLVCHVQIKRKRNIINNQNLNTNPSKIEQNSKIDNNINKQYKHNQSLNKNNTVIKSRRVNTSNNNTDENIARKKITKSNPKIQGSNFFYQSQNNKVNTTPINSTRYSTNRNNNNIINKISPIKTVQNNKINIDINKINKNDNNNEIINNNTTNQNNNSKFHYSIRNFNNVENNLPKNNYKNYSLINKDNKIKKELSKQNMLTEIKELEYNESNDNDLIEDNKTSINLKKGAITDEEKLKKTQRINNTGIKDMKKSYQKEFKNKKYYGYDDRHNLEGTINNHTTYVSKYTKKVGKIN